MSREEGGYATLAATALMSALSIVAIGYLELSLTKSRMIEATTDAVMIDIKLENAIFEQIAKITSRTEPVPRPMLVQEVSQDNLSFRWQIEFENEKLDLNRSDIEKIKQKISPILGPEKSNQAISLIRTSRAEIDSRFKSVNELASVFGENSNCLKQYLTVFSSQSKILGPTAEHRSVQDGDIIRLVAETVDHTPPRSLEVIFLITGKTNEPFWIMDWSRSAIVNIGDCENAY